MCYFSRVELHHFFLLACLVGIESWRYVCYISICECRCVPTTSVSPMCRVDEHVYIFPCVIGLQLNLISYCFGASTSWYFFSISCVQGWKSWYFYFISMWYVQGWALSIYLVHCNVFRVDKSGISFPCDLGTSRSRFYGCQPTFFQHIHFSTLNYTCPQLYR